MRPASELGSLAQQWSFNQNDVVSLTNRYSHTQNYTYLDVTNSCSTCLTGKLRWPQNVEMMPEIIPDNGQMIEWLPCANFLSRRRDTVLGTYTSVRIAWAHARRILLTSVLLIACEFWLHPTTQPWRDSRPEQQEDRLQGRGENDRLRRQHETPEQRQERRLQAERERQRAARLRR